MTWEYRNEAPGLGKVYYSKELDEVYYASV